MGHAEGHNPFHALNVGETTYNREPVMYFYLCPLYAGGNCEWSVNNYSNGLNPTPTPIYVDDCARCRDLSGRSLHRLTGEGASGKTRTARPLANPEEREAELRGKGR